MISAISTDFFSPELLHAAKTSVDYHYLNTVRLQNVTSPEVVFADVNLASRIRSILSIPAGAPVTQAELAALRTLTIISGGITNLSGLEHAINLVQIAVPGNQIEDLAPLNGLALLVQIIADSNEIFELSTLTDLPALKQLGVNFNNITDISPVNNFVGLQMLSADSNNISDISSLTHLVNMQQFSLADNHVADISIVKNFPKLKGVYLSGNPLSTIEPLRNITTLQFAALSDTGISDFSALAERDKLRRVEISGNNVTDISFITKSKDYVQTIIAESNDIVDLSPLTAAANLRQIDLYNNQNLADIAPLENAPLLTLEVIVNTAVTELTYVSKNISGLYLAHDDIADFSSIDNLKNLLEINAADTGITDAKFINGNALLSIAILDENHITDLRGIEKVPSLNFSVAEQSVALGSGVVGQPSSLSLFNPDGTVPEITWLTPGTYDPLTETVTWKNEGLNSLTWSDATGSTYEFSGSLVQYATR